MTNIGDNKDGSSVERCPGCRADETVELARHGWAREVQGGRCWQCLACETRWFSAFGRVLHSWPGGTRDATDAGCGCVAGTQEAGAGEMA